MALEKMLGRYLCLITGGRDPPLHNVGLNIFAETLNNVGHPTRCPQPLDSVRLMVSYIALCLHNDFFYAHIVRGGGVPATCV